MGSPAASALTQPGAWASGRQRPRTPVPSLPRESGRSGAGRQWIINPVGDRQVQAAALVLRPPSGQAVPGRRLPRWCPPGTPLFAEPRAPSRPRDGRGPPAGLAAVGAAPAGGESGACALPGASPLESQARGSWVTGRAGTGDPGSGQTGRPGAQRQGVWAEVLGLPGLQAAGLLGHRAVEGAAGPGRPGASRPRAAADALA